MIPALSLIPRAQILSIKPSLNREYCTASGVIAPPQKFRCHATTVNSCDMLKYISHDACNTLANSAE